MAVGIKAFDMINDDSLLAHVRAIGDRLTAGLRELAERYPDIVVDVRGKGLLIGVKLIPNNREMMAMVREEGLLVAGGGDNCIRLLPPLILSEAEADEALDRLETAFAVARRRLADAA
jgi:acetylornithine/N-succinyldiaminopimelate aminotransferase